MRLVGMVAALCGVLLFAASAQADGVALNKGDVLAAVGSGLVRHYDSSGNLLDTLNTTTNDAATAGMCFDQAKDVFVTDFVTSQVSKFDKNGNLVTASFGSGFNAHPEGCTVDATGDIYVGQADGTHSILKFDSSGNLLATFTPAAQNRGTDHIDIASDQCTMDYTSEGDLLKQFNVCTNTQLPDFATLPTSPCYAHRILTDGSELVACSSEVVHVGSNGSVIKTYPEPTDGSGTNTLFAINLDPDGTSFWTGDLSSGDVWRIGIASGNELTHFKAALSGVLGGLAVVGEITAGQPQDKQITATAPSALNAPEGHRFSGTVATFTDPDTAATPGEYSATINWGDGQSSTGTISGSGGSFTVTGTHTYAEEGSHPVSVTITDTDTTANSASANTTANVADAALSASGVSKKSKKNFSGTVATFSDQDPAGTTSDYTATIDWGDGSTSTGSVAGGFKVNGSHAFAKAGTYQVRTTVKDGGGSTATATSTVKVKSLLVDADLKITQVTSAAAQSGCATEMAIISALGLSCTQGKITVTGTIDKHARGKVHVKITASLPSGAVSASGDATIDHGHWTTTLTLPGINQDPNPPTYVADAAFNGSPGVKKGHDEKRATLEVEQAGLGPI